MHIRVSPLQALDIVDNNTYLLFSCHRDNCNDNRQQQDGKQQSINRYYYSRHHKHKVLGLLGYDAIKNSNNFIAKQQGIEALST